MQAEEFQVKAWAQRAEQQGHELSEDDLLEEFKLILESKVWQIEEQRETHGFLLEAEEKALSRCHSRLTSLTRQSNIRYTKARLRFVCNLVSLRPGNVVPFTAAENDCVCKLSWQSWDFLVHLLTPPD